MANNEPFGFDPEDLERAVRDAFDRLGRFVTLPTERAGWSALFDEFTRNTRQKAERETAGEAGDGVWAIYTVDADGGAHVEQVYATELDALRANKHNTDPQRKVRFLPYGIAVSVLDSPKQATEQPE